MELKRYLQGQTVAQVGYKKPVTVGPEASVREAIGTMGRNRVGFILVVEAERLRGIFTERDLIKRVLHANRPLDTPVAAVMTADPVCGREDEPVSHALARMHAGGFRHLPVLSPSKRLAGTLSLRRVARVMADHFGRFIYNLPPEPDRYGETREGA